MAIATTDYGTLFSAIFVEKFRQNSVLVGLADRSYEAQARIAGIAKIPVSAAAPLTTAYSAPQTPSNYADPNNSGAISYVDLKLDQVRQINAALSRDAVRTINAPLVVDMANEIADDISVLIEDYIFDSVIDAASISTGESVTLGVAAVYITPAGVATGTAASKLPYSALQFLRRRAGVKKFLGRSGSGNRYAVVMHPLVLGVLSEYLIEQGIAGQIGYDLLAARQIGASAGYVGTFMGMDIYETISANKVHAISSKDHWQVFGFPYGNHAYGELPPLVNYYTPETNQLGPYHAFRGLAQYGASAKRASNYSVAYIRDEA